MRNNQVVNGLPLSLIISHSTMNNWKLRDSYELKLGFSKGNLISDANRHRSNDFVCFITRGISKVHLSQSTIILIKLQETRFFLSQIGLLDVLG